MVDETLPASNAPMSASHGGALLAGLGIGALALFATWLDPADNAWAAGALIAGLVVDGLGRIAGRMVLRGGPASHVVPPSVVLGSDWGLLAVAGLLAVVLIVWQDGFPVLASLVAGLLAMGGIARLAIARIVTAEDAGGNDPDG